MPIDHDDKEPSLKMEAIERRGEPRGIVRNLKVSIGSEQPRQAVEASRKGFFVSVEDPEDYRLGDSVEIRVQRDDVGIGCRCEVTRKQLEPRKGIALRIAHIAPVAEETLKTMLGY